MEFIDLKAQYRALKDRIDPAVQEVFTSARFIGGENVKRLEADLAEFTGRRHCITCGSGTDALQAAFMVYGVGEGDAVFCPDITFIASTEPAYMLGATPVFCDIERGSYNLSPESLERQVKAVLEEGKLTPRAVIAVDFLGNIADYTAIGKICDKYNMILIEDGAQAFGSDVSGRRACSFGDISCTSFFPAKPLGCYGDGGALFTDDDEIAAKCRSICVHGKGPNGKYDNIRIGMNSRLDSVQAAILLVKLEALKKTEIAARKKIAENYNAAFSPYFEVQKLCENCTSVYAQYVALAKDREQRDAITSGLSGEGIPNMVYYPLPQHSLPVFSKLDTYGETFEVADDYCDRTFSLPMHPYLGEEEQKKIISAVLSFIR